jgi:hypothetical protein
MLLVRDDHLLQQFLANTLEPAGFRYQSVAQYLDFSVFRVYSIKADSCPNPDVESVLG